MKHSVYVKTLNATKFKASCMLLTAEGHFSVLLLGRKIALK